MGGKNKKKHKEDTSDGRVIVARNRKALRDYEVLAQLEVGLVLQGTEVRSLREGGGTIRDAYAQVIAGELWLIGSHIAPYANAGYSSHDPDRRRKLLAHRREILRLAGKLKEKGLTLVPLSLYFREGRAKLELGLAKGRTEHGRREEVAERDRRRQLRAARGDRDADI